jgi:hypothetical protein
MLELVKAGRRRERNRMGNSTKGAIREDKTKIEKP